MTKTNEQGEAAIMGVVVILAFSFFFGIIYQMLVINEIGIPLFLPSWLFASILAFCLTLLPFAGIIYDMLTPGGWF